MKKHLLLFLAVILSISAFAADLNPFAYDLSTSINSDGGTRLHFSINAPAPRVEVYIVVGGYDKLLRTYTNVTKNSYYTDISASDANSLDISQGNSYNWKVKVTTPDRSSSAEYVTRVINDKPVFSMDIDNNPSSPYFGRVLVSQGAYKPNGNNIDPGIYAYKADFTGIGGRNKSSNVTISSEGWYGYNHLTPYRIRIAQDGSGRIFLGNYDVSQSSTYLWQVDPANLSSWTQLISRSYMNSNAGVNTDGIANSGTVYNFGLDVRTTGNKYELLLLSGLKGGAYFVTGQVYSGIYTIPNISSPTSNITYKQLRWASPANSESSIRNLFGSALNSSAIFDKFGGAWYCGNSSSGTQGSYPGLAHQVAVQTSYKIDYDDSNSYFTKKYTASGGIRYDKNHSRIAIAQGDARTNIAASIYTVTQANASTHPTLASRVDLNAGSVKGSTEWFITDIAWDYADNVYLCVRNVDKDVRGVYAFATDLGGNIMDVAARNAFTLQLPSGVKEGTKGLNPYAYDVRATYDEATHKLTVNFSLNDDAYNDGTGGNADGVQIYLSDDPANPKKWYVDGVPANMCFKGENKTRNIDLSTGKDLRGTDLPRNTDLYVSVTVQGDRTNTRPREVDKSHQIYFGQGIAVNKNPFSKNFGKIFVTEAWQNYGKDLNGNLLSSYITQGLAGMYVINPNFDFNTTRYTGGNDFSYFVIDHQDPYSQSLKKRGFQPWRVRVSEEGRIFICSNDMHQRQTPDANSLRDGIAIWEVDTTNFDTWTPILRGKRQADYTFTYKDVNGNNQFIGPVCGMDVRGKGDNLTLLIFTANKSGVDYNSSGFRAYEYNVKSKALTPISAFNSGGYGIAFEYLSLVYGVDGSFWFGASRATGTQRNLAHVKSDKTSADYDNYNTEFRGGGGLINYKSTYNNSTINNTNHSWLIKGKDNAGGSNGYFDVFLVPMTAGGGADVTRMDGNGGRPNWQKIQVTGMKRSLNDFAVDYAENLYVVGDEGHLLRAFAMPYCGEKTTPALNQAAREQYKFQLKGQPVTWHAYHCPESMTNEDLWELFMEDYNEWYLNKKIITQARSPQQISGALGFMYVQDDLEGTYPDGLVVDFIQNHPKWNWLYNYINTVVNNEASSPTSNEALWSAFKSAAEITTLGTLAELREKDGGGFIEICQALTIAKLQTVFDDSNWSWLKQHIMDTQEAQLSTSILCDNGTTRNPVTLKSGYTYGDPNGAPWRYATAAFFLQSQYKAAYPASADFSTAGLPSTWGPKASAAGKTYAFSLTGELTWRLHVHSFFNKTSHVTYPVSGENKITATADFTHAGDPYEWYDLWADVTFPKTMSTGDAMPKIKRSGYIFSGWYYGTEDGFTRAQKVADSGYDENVTNNKHIWARWQEVCFYEGYVKHPDEHDFDIKDRKDLNYNEDLVRLAEGKSIQIDVERKLQSGMYNTMMLPFAIPKKDDLLKVTDMDGTNIFDPDKGGAMPSILVYEGFETINVGGEDMLQIIFHELGDGNHDNNEDSEGRKYESIFAYTPFFIQPNSNITSRMHFWPAYISEAVAVPQLGEGVSFVPHFVPNKVTVPEGASALILVAENRLAHLVGDDEMLGLRGYFLVPEALSNQPAQICVKTNSETGMKDIFVPDEAEASAYKILQKQRVLIIRENKIYDIMGNLLYEL